MILMVKRQPLNQTRRYADVTLVYLARNPPKIAHPYITTHTRHSPSGNWLVLWVGPYQIYNQTHPIFMSKQVYMIRNPWQIKGIPMSRRGWYNDHVLSIQDWIS